MSRQSYLESRKSPPLSPRLPSLTRTSPSLTDLPPELYFEVSRHLPTSSQISFRSLNRAIYQEPEVWKEFDWKECCREPTTLEIAKWLMEERYHLAFGLQEKSVLKPRRPRRSNDKHKNEFFERVAKEVDIVFVKDTLGRPVTFGEKIKFNLEFGTLSGTVVQDSKTSVVSLNTLEDCILYISNRPLELEDPPYETLNWAMIRDILSKRKSCITHRISSDVCYTILLAKHIPTLKQGLARAWIYRFIELKSLLTTETYNRLIEDFKTRFGIKDDLDDLHSYLTSHFRDKFDLDAEFNSWLEPRLESLFSWHLSLNPFINRENIRYT